ncbi:MAG: TRAP transporter small permease [Castellaniella sp.]|uniref:TRAP transporter small permease n=1 Tax=Castellaniella sp. TaxID=1955812 RepID=UPI003C77FFF0
MKSNDLLGRLAEGLARAAQALACCLLVGMFLLINIEVLCRYFFSTSTLVADEYSAYFFAAMVYLGLSHCLHHDKLIKIDLPESWSPVVKSPLVLFILSALGIAFNALLVYSMYLTTMASLRFQTRSIQPSQTVLAYPQLAVLAALCAAVLAGVFVLVRSFRATEGRVK